MNILYLWLYSPLLDLVQFFQFLNPIHSRYYSLDEGSARRKVTIYTQNNDNYNIRSNNSWTNSMKTRPAMLDQPVSPHFIVPEHS
jgi:hypothetical protein